MKPIEPGCLCIHMGRRNAGKELTALRFIGAFPDDVGLIVSTDTPRDWWAVDTPIATRDADTGEHLGFFLCAREVYLLRIDGHEEEKTKEREKVECD